MSAHLHGKGERIYIQRALPKFREVMESMGYPRMNQKLHKSVE